MKPSGVDLAVVQIAGLVARRIKCDLKDGEDVCRGDRFGIIRFGSRLDNMLPAGARTGEAGPDRDGGRSGPRRTPIMTKLSGTGAGRVSSAPAKCASRENHSECDHVAGALRRTHIHCFAFAGDWHGAVAAIVCAAILDTLDGRVARLLKANSLMGAQLDSLADLVNFGVAPSLLIYMWTLHDAGLAGWALVYFLFLWRASPCAVQS